MTPTLGALSASELSGARQRLGTAAALFAVVFTIGVFGGIGWYWAGGREMVMRYDLPFDVPTAGLWIVLAVLVRMPFWSDRAALVIGQGLLLAICLIQTTIASYNALEHGQYLPLLSWNAFVIAVYPLLIPSPPRVTAVVTTIFALTAPLSMALTIPLGQHPTLPHFIAVSVAPAIAAVIAVLGSDFIHRYSVSIGELRDQEALLQAVTDATAEALVLSRDDGEVVFANPAARALFGPDMMGGSTTLRRAVEEHTDGLVVDASADAPQSYLVTNRAVVLDERPHGLLVIRRLTQELDRAEVDSWKKLIRALSHELNNSLAPMSSTLYSVRQMIGKPAHRERLEGAVGSLERRVEHLGEFLSGYAGLARLPDPRPGPVAWRPFLDHLARLASFTIEGDLPDREGVFDEGQIEQVLLNLVKNAEEAGSPSEAIRVSVRSVDGGFEIAVLDRGHGVSDEARERATLPFWSTRADGTGLGLALSRDIVVGHGGWLSLDAR